MLLSQICRSWNAMSGSHRMQNQLLAWTTIAKERMNGRHVGAHTTCESSRVSFQAFKCNDPTEIIIACWPCIKGKPCGMQKNTVHSAAVLLSWNRSSRLLTANIMYRNIKFCYSGRTWTEKNFFSIWISLFFLQDHCQQSKRIGFMSTIFGFQDVQRVRNAEGANFHCRKWYGRIFLR